MKRLCSICARGGSKGVKNKNLIDMEGLPLIAHSLIQARQTGLFDHIAVSSDSDAILEAAKAYGADIIIKRPDSMATDTAAKLPVIKHCFLEAETRTGIEFDIICDLDATSPLRLPDDIKACVDLLELKGEGNVITGAPSRRSPYFNLVEDLGNGRVQLCKPPQSAVVRRQDAPRTFDMNASVYVWTRQSILKDESVFTNCTWLYEMPEERSIDIDSPLDLLVVRLLMKQRLNPSTLGYD